MDIYRSLSHKDNYMLLASLVGVEVQRDLWVHCEVFDFIRFCLAENEETILHPNKPDGPGLGRQIRIDSRQPDNVLVIQMFFYNASKF